MTSSEFDIAASFSPLTGFDMIYPGHTHGNIDLGRFDLAGKLNTSIRKKLNILQS